ncbi:hypothetical protein ACFQ7F_29685 [Streptomyces sp. NPDC056486]|uniref:hypothetical protein n=1 Tax=Streptomyces sp. NPDC056486 TaxID=3345835 RepID=UPI0036ABBC4F
MDMTELDDLPSAVGAGQLLPLADGCHARSAQAPGRLRPGRAGLAHERDAYVRCVLDGGGTLAERLTARGRDVIEGDLR